MKVRQPAGQGESRIELHMTPMIDIVFQLLVFFIMTFKIVSQEGDFDITMPRSGGDITSPPKTLVINVRMTAYSAEEAVALNRRAGDLKTLQYDGNSLKVGYRPLTEAEKLEIGADRDYEQIVAVESTFGPIRNSLISLIDKEDYEVNVFCDPELRYEQVINAMTYISGYLEESTDGSSGNPKVKKLIDKINLQRLD